MPRKQHSLIMSLSVSRFLYLAPFRHAHVVWSFGITIYELLHGCRPYRQWRPDKDYISRMQFGSHLTPEARSFIKAILVVDPRKRLGCGLHGWDEVKRHPWFKTIQWSEVAAKRAKPPFQPDLEHANCSNQADLADQLIDKKPEPIPPELQKHFIGFDWNIELNKPDTTTGGDGEEKTGERKVGEVAPESKIAAVTMEDDLPHLPHPHRSSSADQQQQQNQQAQRSSSSKHPHRSSAASGAAASPPAASSSPPQHHHVPSSSSISASNHRHRDKAPSTSSRTSATVVPIQQPASSSPPLRPTASSSSSSSASSSSHTTIRIMHNPERDRTARRLEQQRS